MAFDCCVALQFDGALVALRCSRLIAAIVDVVCCMSYAVFLVTRHIDVVLFNK